MSEAKASGCALPAGCLRCETGRACATTPAGLTASASEGMRSDMHASLRKSVVGELRIYLY